MWNAQREGILVISQMRSVETRTYHEGSAGAGRWLTALCAHALLAEVGLAVAHAVFARHGLSARPAQARRTRLPGPARLLHSEGKANLGERKAWGSLLGYGS